MVKVDVYEDKTRFVKPIHVFRDMAIVLFFLLLFLILIDWLGLGL